MQQFPVDDEVVAAVWQRAKPKPFENLSFNLALRRVLDLAEDSTVLPNKPDEARPSKQVLTNSLDDLVDKSSLGPRRSKAPKADIKEMIRAGLLRDGEELFLVDYHGARLQQSKATIAGGGLLFKGQYYSMSDLARDLLKKVGYQSDSVRGPAHWANAKGVTVRDLWQQLLDKRNKK
jgi:hypothetical protein